MNDEAYLHDEPLTLERKPQRALETFLAGSNVALFD